MSVRVNVHMSKFMCTPIKLGVRTYAMYANFQTMFFYRILVLIFQQNTLFSPGFSETTVKGFILISGC